MTIKEYIIKKYLKSESAYLKLYKLSVGEKIITQKWLEDHQNIKSFVSDWLIDLFAFYNTEHPNTTFFMKSNGDFVFEYNKVELDLFVRYEGFWSVLTRKYSMKYSDAYLVIKYMVEEGFKFKIIASHQLFTEGVREIEDTFKSEIETIRIVNICSVEHIEDLFNEMKHNNYIEKLFTSLCV